MKENNTPVATQVHEINSDEVIIVNQNINNNIDSKILYAYNVSYSIKILACIDIFFNVLYSFYHYFYLFPVILSLFGYLGAKYYNKIFIFIYSIYIMFFNIIKLVLVHYIYSSNSSIYFSNLIFTFINILIGFWILKIVCNFYKALNLLNEEELNILKNLKNIKYTFLYY